MDDFDQQEADDGRRLRAAAGAAAPWVLGTWVVILAVLLACCGPVGCGGQRAPAADPVRAQAHQNAAEADSGMAAAKAKLGAAMTPELLDILDGSAAFARATIGKDQAPAARWTVERIMADPAGYRAAGMSAERHANGTWNLWALGVAAMAIAPIALYAAKFIPVVGPYVETVGNIGWKFLASRASKDQEKARDQVYAHTASVWDAALSMLPPDQAERLIRKVPVEVHAAIMKIPTPPAPPAQPTPPVA
jgi:hypothetical protein